MAISGDLLLLLNNVVLSAVFIPTLLKPGANVSVVTAGVYVVMIAVGAAGYFMNGQWGPGVATAVGSGLWGIMLIKSIRFHRSR